MIESIDFGFVEKLGLKITDTLKGTFLYREDELNEDTAVRLVKTRLNLGMFIKGYEHIDPSVTVVVKKETVPVYGAKGEKLTAQVRIGTFRTILFITGKNNFAIYYDDSNEDHKKIVSNLCFGDYRLE